MYGSVTLTKIGHKIMSGIINTVQSQSRIIGSGVPDRTDISCRAYRGGNFAPTDNTTTPIPFNDSASNQTWDTDNMHNPSGSGADRTQWVVCKTEGLYVITGGVKYKNDSHAGYRTLYIYLNGTQSEGNQASGGRLIAWQNQHPDSTSDHHFINVTAVWHLKVNDHVELLTSIGGVGNNSMYSWDNYLIVAKIADNTSSIDI